MRVAEGWTVLWLCDHCGAEIERREYGQRRRSGRQRRWCSDACRMRAARRRRTNDLDNDNNQRLAPSKGII